MSRCSKLVDMGRRQFLRGSTFAVAGAAVAVSMPGEATAAAPAGSGSARVEYPSNKLGNVKDLKVNEPLDVTYPDADAPGVLLKLGKKVPGGMGPEGDIVGYSVTCPHKGFPLNYSAEKRTFNCPGHYSVFDPEAGGQEIWGQATSNLPQYSLRIDDKGDIYAEGLDELLYGRLSNVL